MTTTPPTSVSPPPVISVTPRDGSPSRPDAPIKQPSSRPPTLNQLAARINAVSPPTTSSTAPGRPRLAAQLLRTGSQVSLSSAAASAADSTVVNPPSTRSVSPGASSRASSPPESVASAAGANGTAAGGTAAGAGGGEALTAERLEKLNAEGEKKVKVGYKNIPSLDAITARLAMARSLSVDGSTKPPEPETYDDPTTPGIPQKVPEHPLQHSWTMYYDSKAKIPFTPASAGADGATTHPPVTDTGDYEAGLTVIGEFETVESFCRYFNWLKPPSKLERNSNYHLFKTGIKPMWEDPANADGGKWVLTMKNSPALLDRCWSWLAMALVGEELDEGDEICGAVVSLRSKVDRIQLWIRGKDDVERVNGIGRKLVKTLDITESDGIGLEFQYNSDDRPPPNRYLSIHSSFPQSGFRSSFSHGQPNTHSHSNSYTSSHAPAPAGLPADGPASAGPGGAFGNFAVPGAGFGSGGGWRGGKRA